ncbi:FKBP-type peptidyl-prolyl cis-trans isomerase [Streptomyces sp. ISL-44]|uniref:FKBP-type peptidyl-prolyl cis-trans isomerase n=1 Tax=unclassified Streptomyces TaxID=2593676 RepID=UPI001BE7990C|nr:MULTISPECIES: FKBP-type peptidyl-prolyl cis-trans isomerase [unclassified Streptomyces]MBT2540478.1 FKBP-type peptidyl-prolyl cis-trans isomerase [Streptomyces sp. ISL-44]MCX5016503.1 FKBP-type peptidyl-prolyl cis-trans isomerase [Streptomyces sp. NBC_00555]UUU42828.1 FKBP-type peptidyl-prolyl cis-trans isomerase [Streptomyces sp. NBC_00162]
MRRLAGLLVVPLLLLSTAACGDDSGSDSAQMKNGVPSITKGAKFGETPTLSKGKGEPPKELKVETLSEGDGPALKKGDIAQVNYLGQVWDGKDPFDASFGKGKPFDVTIGAGMVIKGWDQGLEGQKVGSRVELVIPPALGYGEQGSGEKIKPNATLVFVVDIVKGTSVPASATGKEVAQENKDLPKVGTNTDGKEVSVTVPKDTAEPAKLVSNYVLEGDGAVVKDTDNVVVKFNGKTWKDDKTFESTYATDTTVTWPMEQLSVKGLKDGLLGKKVGSRILLVIPPDLAFGDKEQGTIPAKSTLVFSLDILAVM